MLSLGTVQEDATIYFYFSTAAADGGEENFSATLEEADIPIYKDGAVMTLTASTITITNLATGLYELTINLGNDTDFTTGSEYWVLLDASDETIDAQAVSAVIGHFRIESASEQAARIFREHMYPAAAPTATTGNTTTAINLTGILDASAEADDVIGEILAVAYEGGTYDGLILLVRVTDYVVTNQLATVEQIADGGALPETVAAGDYVFRIGVDPAYRGGVTMTEVGGDGDHLTAVVWNAAWDAEVQSEVEDAMAARSTVAGFLDVNTQYINDAAVVGDGNATPWDGA